MKTFTLHLALFAVLLPQASSLGATMMLRKQATQRGTVIRLGDIADISATSPAEMNELSNTPLLAAPAPGTQQFLTAIQIRDLLTSRGVRLNQHTLKGATVVQLGSSTPSIAQATTQIDTQPLRSSTQHTQTTAPSKVKPTTQATLSISDLKDRLHQAIEQHAIQSTGHLRWNIEVMLDKRTLANASDIIHPLKASSSQKVRSGRQRFLLTDTVSGFDFSVLANVIKVQAVVVVKRRIERGQVVRANDVEIRDREGNLPGNPFTELQQIVGKETLRLLRPEEIVQPNHVRAALQIRRGETVNVYVRTGSIVVRTRAVAKEDGAMGDLITLETLDSKQRLDASVSGPGEALVYATGGRATDYASLNRPTVQLR